MFQGPCMVTHMARPVDRNFSSTQFHELYVARESSPSTASLSTASAKHKSLAKHELSKKSKKSRMSTQVGQAGRPRRSGKTQKVRQTRRTKPREKLRRGRLIFRKDETKGWLYGLMWSTQNIDKRRSHLESNRASTALAQNGKMKTKGSKLLNQ